MEKMRERRKEMKTGKWRKEMKRKKEMKEGTLEKEKRVQEGKNMKVQERGRLPESVGQIYVFSLSKIPFFLFKSHFEVLKFLSFLPNLI